MKLSPRENLLRTLRRQGFEQVPVDPGCFCPSQTEAFKKRFGHEDHYAFFQAPMRHAGIPTVQSFNGWKEKYYRHEELPADTEFDAFGVGHSHRPGCFHMTRMHHPLKGEGLTADDVLRYPLPKLAENARSHLREKCDQLHQDGLAVMGCLGCTVWECSWYIRSMEDLMADMLTGEETAALLLDRVSDLACERARCAVEAGADLLQLGDDIGMQSSPMMSLDLWRQWLQPRLKKVIDAARSVRPDILIFYHSCGYVLPFLDGLIEAGVDILNPVQPECMQFEEVHARVGTRLSFWSTIGTQTTLPFGKPDEVRETVWRNLRICGNQGGIVIGPTHMVEPEVPWENLMAMKEACENFRLN
ncbi:MAG: uroporphyrinogen decarboxylase family protein [Verrucomicrobiae bacterium]|nr:uroporphyrinogen decarboxylase family protein [Verrucomicrobiae bacterium]